MKDIDIDWLEQPDELDDPILIEGLPGVEGTAPADD